MKRKMLILLAAFMFGCGVVSAATLNGLYHGRPIVKVTYQGKVLQTDEVPAQMLDDRTMVPLGLLRQLGYDLKWDGTTYSVDIKPTEQAASRRKLTSQEIAKLTVSVGIMTTYDSSGKPIKQGTGFTISEAGLTISAHHVIDGGAKIDFTNNGKRNFFSTPEFDNTQTDLFGVMLSKLPGNEGKIYPYLAYTTKLPEVGDKVYHIGYPGGTYALTEGFVSKIFVSNGVTYIVHSAPTDHGSSGGVLLNEYGEVLGIVVDGEKLSGIAVPMMYVQQEIDKSH